MTVTRTFDIIDQLENNYRKQDALAIKRNGQWEKFSTSEYRQRVDEVSYGLMAMGLKKGDKIITVSNNRPEWNFLDMGMSQLGVVHVPVYPNQGEEEYKHILHHSDARMVIVSTEVYYEKLKALVAEASNIEWFFTIDPVRGADNWEEILGLGRANPDAGNLNAIKSAIDPDELMSIIYTSGTTGRSKGVMLSHRNFISNLEGTAPILPIDNTHRFLSFLPLCHVLERMVNYLIQYKGASVYYAESIDTIGENLREVAPHGFTSVPRVLEKLYDKILLKGKELKGVKKSLFFWAVDIALGYELDRANGWFYELKRAIADKLIFSKWRVATGGNIRVIISGGAALQERLARVFHCAGIPIMEGYGLTETAPVISVNQASVPYLKFGTVGPVLQNVEVKIADDGEILMKGPNLMLGYYKQPDMTAEVIDNEGWFHTGDIGVLLEHRILKITDRKKEIFKLTTGKYVAPQIVENRFKESPLIEQIMVVGEGEKYAAAIICPAFHFLHGWCHKHGIKYRDNKDLIQNPKVLARYHEEVDQINKELGNHRQIKKFELTCADWTPETGELSPTLKVKRKFLKEKYKIKLDRLYGYTEDPGHVGIPDTSVEKG